MNSFKQTPRKVPDPDQHPQLPSQYQLPLNSIKSSEETADTCNLRCSRWSYITLARAQYHQRIEFLDGEYFCRQGTLRRIPEGNLAALSHRWVGHYPEPPVAADCQMEHSETIKENIKTMEQGFSMWTLCHNSQQEYSEMEKIARLQN